MSFILLNKLSFLKQLNWPGKSLKRIVAGGIICEFLCLLFIQ